MLSQAHVDLSFPVSYVFNPASDSTRGLMVLHGFSDHAESVTKRLIGKNTTIEGATLLAPNALFPAPVKKGDEYKEAYSWYFRDPKTGMQMSSPEFAAAAVVKLVNHLDLNHLTWVVLGFSQGGFFAPHLIRAGLNIKTIIAVGAAFRPEAYQGLKPFRLHAIHGQDDQVVEHEVSKNSFEVWIA